MIYNNLAAELVRNKISVAKAASALGVTQKTFRNKMQGDTDWTWSQICAIRRFFPIPLDLDYLFASDKDKVA